MMVASPSLAQFVRRHDPDRFFCTLFAPDAAREILFTLYAFNHEIARAREAAREAGLALIRLQWWREVVEGAERGHEVATPLRAALAAGALREEALLAMIGAREAECAPALETVVDWHAYLAGSRGLLAVAAGRVLGADGAQLGRLADLGAGYGAAGILRSVGWLAGQGRCLLPADMLAAEGLTPDDVLADPFAPGVMVVRAALAAQARTQLGRAGALGAAAAAGLVGVLARRDLARLDAPLSARGIGDRLAVVAAAARGIC